MTKTLTEQWREGTLPDGFYYMQDYTGRYCYRYLFGVKPDADFVKCFKEVLSAVPSYDEIKRLQEQLKEANEVIESLRTYDFTVDDENAEYYQVKWNVEAERFYKNKKWGVK